jgi:hypothetical protein
LSFKRARETFAMDVTLPAAATVADLHSQLRGIQDARLAIRTVRRTFAPESDEHLADLAFGDVVLEVIVETH